MSYVGTEAAIPMRVNDYPPGRFREYLLAGGNEGKLGEANEANEANPSDARTPREKVYLLIKELNQIRRESRANRGRR